MKINRTYFETVILAIFILSSVHFIASAFTEKDFVLKEALYYQQLAAKKVQCQLCPRKCVLGEGQLGFCRARKNIDGKLYALGYAKPCAVHLDPIEKKPFFHVLPQTTSFSIASAGCNMRCKFCQNWQIAQFSPLETENFFIPPAEVVQKALKEDAKTIAYTYSEPTNFYEYMLETAKIAKAKGLKNVMHSNGYINQAPLKELCKYLTAANIDLKAFSDDYYHRICSANLGPVLDTLVTLKKEGVWIEITNLILPGENDNPEVVRKMCRWIRQNLGQDTPVHFSRFYPTYQMKNLPPTPVKTLEALRKIALDEGLSYVYIGNVPGHQGENTNCPKCGKVVISRIGYSILENNIIKGQCKFCGQNIKGIWN